MAFTLGGILPLLAILLGWVMDRGGDASRDGRLILAEVRNGDGGQIAYYLGSTDGSWAQVAGFDTVYRLERIGAAPQELTKLTVAPTLTTGRGFMTRPELRLFYTYAFWNAAARGANIDSGQIYRSTSLLSGSIVGVQAETWY